MAVIFGLENLYWTFSQGCGDGNFEALCNHSSSFVLEAIIGAGALAFVFSMIILVLSIKSAKSILESLCKREEKEPRSIGAAILTRTSAFSKLCLLGVY